MTRLSKAGAGTPPSGLLLTVLLVEDDPLLRMSLSDTLTDMGHRVVEASTADEALACLARDSGIGVLITDVGLPLIDGQELARRARESRPDLGVIFATGYSAARIPDPDPASNTRCLRKPFEPKQLAEALDRLCLSANRPAKD